MASSLDDFDPDEPVAWMLRVVVDLGSRPSALAVADYLTALQRLFDLGAKMEYGRRPERYFEYDQRILIAVSRMRLASPFDVLLTSAAGVTPIVGYVAAGWLMVERTLRLVMDWQNHRQALAERQMELIQRGRETAVERLLRTSPIQTVERVEIPTDLELSSSEQDPKP
jgi:hypothetical protein